MDVEEAKVGGGAGEKLSHDAEVAVGSTHMRGH